MTLSAQDNLRWIVPPYWLPIVKQCIWYYYGLAINYKPGHVDLIPKIWSSAFVRPLPMLSCVDPGDLGWQDNHKRARQLLKHHPTFAYSKISLIETALVRTNLCRITVSLLEVERLKWRLSWALNLTIKKNNAVVRYLLHLSINILLD